MSWWISIIEYLRNTENGHDNGKFSVKKSIIRALAESAVDLLYYAVGFFTFVYFWIAIYLFFWGGGANHDVAVRVFDSLSEPYLGSVGIYTIMKEIRKRYHRTKSRHFGEYFVLAWTILFLISGTLVLYTDRFIFDDLMGAITTIAMAIIVIYTGGLIHKP